MPVNTSTRPTMIYEIKRGILVAVHGTDAPADNEWEGYLQLAQDRRQDFRTNLVFTEGGGPDSRQRARIAELPDVGTLPTAVVSHSVAVRGIVTAISWLGKDIQAFAPTDLRAAFSYLGLSETFRANVLEQIAQMKLKLAGVSLDAIQKSVDDEGVPAGQLGEISDMLEFVVVSRLERLRGRVRARE